MAHLILLRTTDDLRLLSCTLLECNQILLVEHPKNSVITRAYNYTNRSCNMCIQCMHTHMLNDNT